MMLLFRGVLVFATLIASALAQCEFARLEVFGSSNSTTTTLQPYLNCSFSIVTSPGLKLDLFISGHLPSPSSTHLTVYDGTNAGARVLTTIYGATSADTISSQTRTSGNQAWVNFFADGIYEAGMSITIEAESGVYDTAYCTGLTNLINIVGMDGLEDSSSSVSNPTFYTLQEPHNSIHYLPGQACGWLIVAAPGRSIQLTTQNPGPPCFLGYARLKTGDSLVVFDGQNSSAPVLAVTAAVTGGASLVAFSSSNYMYVLLNTTAGDKYSSGFSLQLSELDTLSTCQPGLLRINSSTNPWGIAEPRMYAVPLPHLAPPNTCRWLYLGQPKSVIRFYGLGYSSQDSLVFHDGPSTSDRALYKGFAASSSSTSGMDATGNEVLIEFTPAPGGSPGFGVKVLEETVCQCGDGGDNGMYLLDLTSPSSSSCGTFGPASPAPSFAINPYYGPMTCVWRLVNASDSTRVSLSLSLISLAPNDTVMIYDGDVGSGGPLLGNLTSASSGSATFTSITRSMHVVFTARGHGSSHHVGFDASYSLVDAEIPQCAPYTELINVGTLTAPLFFDGVTQFANNLTCVWNITGLPGSAIDLTYAQVSTDLGGGHLRIFDGTTTAARLLNDFTGASGQTIHVTASSSQMLVVFDAGGPQTPTGYGFKATVTLVTPVVPPLTGYNGLCSNASTVRLDNDGGRWFCLSGTSSLPQEAPGGPGACQFLTGSPTANVQTCSWHVVPSGMYTASYVTVYYATAVELEVYQGTNTSPTGTLEVSCKNGCCTRSGYGFSLSGDYTVVMKSESYTSEAAHGLVIEISPGTDATPTYCANHTHVVATPSSDIIRVSDGNVALGHNCTWNISALEPTYGVQIGMRYSAPTVCDHTEATIGEMAFYEGGSETPVVVLSLDSWWQFNGFFYIFTPPLIVTYTGPPAGQRLQVGFPDIEYSSNFAPVFCSGVQEISAVGFGEYFSSMTPFYSDKAYPPGTDCGYLIRACEDCIVRALIAPFLGKTGTITFHDGPDETSHSLHTFVQASGNNTVNVTSSGSTMFMRFTGGNGRMEYKMSGFTMTVYELPRPPWCSGEVHVDVYSQYNYDMQTSIMQMFDDSLSYPRNLHCVFHLHAPEGTHIVGYIAPKTEYLGDIITVYEQGRVLASVSGLTNGNSYDLTFESLCNTLTVVFTSNNVTTSADVGWSLATRLITYPDSSDAFPAACRRDPNSGVCGAITVCTAADAEQYANCTLALESVTVTATCISEDNITLPLLESAPLLDIRISSQVGWISMPALRSAEIIHLYATKMAGLDVPLLRTTQDLGVATVNTPTHLAFPSLYVAHGMTISGSVQTLEMPSLAYVCQLQLCGVHLQTAAINKSVSITNLRVQSAQALQRLDLSESKFIFQITVSASNVDSLNFGSLEECTNLYISGNGRLTTVDVRSMKWAQSFTISQNSQLELLNLNSLTYAAQLSLQSNALKIIDLPALRLVESFFIMDHPNLLSVSANRLLEVDCQFELSGSAAKTLELNSLEIVQSSFTLDSMTYLDTVKMCNIKYIGTLTLGSNPALSCSDLLSMIDQHASSGSQYVVAPGCSPVTLGVFGCASNVVFAVEARCGPYVACIQAQIDAAFSNQGIVVFVPEGEYTNCSAPLNFHGKIVTLMGSSAGRTIVNCGGSGFALLFSESEPAQTIVQDMEFENGIGASGGLVLIDGASPTFSNCIFRGGSAVNGGAVAILSGGTPSFESCVFADNSADTAGGAIYVLDSSILLTNASIVDSAAGREGGALFLSQLTTNFGLALTNLSVSNCHAQRGGAIFSDSAFTLSYSGFTGNSASKFGGALALIPAAALGTNVTLSHMKIASGSAPSGGAVYAFSMNVLLIESTFSTNSATRGNGGAIYATCSESYRFLRGIHGPLGIVLQLVSSELQGNSAAQDGGGLFSRDVFVTLHDMTVNNNIAGGSGAGVAASRSSLSVTSSNFQGNVANSGGGVYCEPYAGICNVIGSTFQQNSASVSGGGIYFCTSGCPGTNTTSDASIITGALPSVVDSTFTNNLVAVNGYGNDTSTDPSQLTWLSQPFAQAVSGRSLVPDGASLTVLVADGYGQVVRSGNLALTLSALDSDTIAASTRASIHGANTVLASRGVAVFTGVSLVADSLNDTGSAYIIQCQLSILPDVILRATVNLLPCAAGQGYDPSASGIVCADCEAGSSSQAAASGYLCLPCAAGQYASVSASESCTPCPVNTSAEQAGSTQCVACPAGYSAETVGSVTCTQLAAATTNSAASLAAPLGGAIAALALLFVLAAMFVWRQARRRTMKKYYLDQDSTIRTNSRETPVMRAVKKMLVASSTTRIGGGLYADVYKAKYENQWVAMKVLKGEMMGNAVALGEFQRETMALSQLTALNHAAIVRLQFFLNRNPMCIGVEFCVNGTLKAHLAAGPVSPKDKVRLMAETASGMAAIHQLYITHLDLKTGNLLLDGDYHVKIADFGIARTHNASQVNLPAEFLHESLYLATVVSPPPSNAASAAPPGDATVHISKPMPHDSLNTMEFNVNPVFNQSIDSMALNSTDSAFGVKPPSSVNSTEGESPDQMAFTPQYVDPVRLVRDRLTDFAFLKEADVFSFAMVMWATMTQTEPYQGEPAMELVERLKGNAMIRPPALTECLPAYASIVERCWSHDRLKRLQFFELVAELDGILKTDFGTSVKAGYETK